MSKLKTAIRRIVPDNIIYSLKDIQNMYNNSLMLLRYSKVKGYEKDKYPYGINLIGDIQAETGLSQSMRIIAGILEKNEIPFVIIQVNQPGDLKHDNHRWDDHIADNPIYSVNVIHVNANEWAGNYRALPKGYMDYRYNIAYWLWELETFPKKWHPCIEVVDEIWAPSEFICNCLRKYSFGKTVCKIPYTIDIKEPTRYDRAHFALPDNVFLYLMMYDQKSISERKNPEGIINSFVKAFSIEEANSKKIGLIIKVNHVDSKNQLLPFEKQLKGYKYVYYLTENMTREEVESLEAVADVLISLHRSEGFGLPPAEAMYLGTPVIATNWSATTEFMKEDCACLVDYKMIELERKIGPYEKGNQWADADVDQAAHYVYKLYEDKAYYDRISENGRLHIRKCLSCEEIGDKIKYNLAKLK